MNEWYYEYNNAQEGPVSVDSLRDLIRREIVARDTLIWKRGMSDWQAAAGVDAFSDAFGSPPPLRASADIGDALPVGPAPTSDRWDGVPPKIDNHLAKAIIVTLLCCLPFGIVAIIQSTKVDPAIARGDYDEARRRSEEANKWANWSMIASAVFLGLYFLFILVIGVGSGY